MRKRQRDGKEKGERLEQRVPGRESLTLRTHSRDKDQAKEMGPGLVQLIDTVSGPGAQLPRPMPHSWLVRMDRHLPP